MKNILLFVFLSLNSIYVSAQFVEYKSVQRSTTSPPTYTPPKFKYEFNTPESTVDSKSANQSVLSHHNIKAVFFGDTPEDIIIRVKLIKNTLLPNRVYLVAFRKAESEDEWQVCNNDEFISLNTLLEITKDNELKKGILDLLENSFTCIAILKEGIIVF